MMLRLPPLLQVDVIESQPDFPTIATCVGPLEIVIGAARLSVTGVVDPILLTTAIAALRA